MAAAPYGSPRDAPRVPSENSIRPGVVSKGRIIESLKVLFAILHALGMFVVDLFKSRSRLEAKSPFLLLQLHRS